MNMFTQKRFVPGSMLSKKHMIKGNMKKKYSSVLFCHTQLFAADCRFQQSQSDPERTQRGWEFGFLGTAFDIKGAVYIPPAYSRFLAVLETLDVFFCRSMDHASLHNYSSESCHQLSGQWLKSQTQSTNRAVPWYQTTIRSEWTSRYSEALGDIRLEILKSFQRCEPPEHLLAFIKFQSYGFSKIFIILLLENGYGFSLPINEWPIH